MSFTRRSDMLPDTEIVALTERLRRNFPRHADVQAVCDVADALLVAKNRGKPSKAGAPKDPARKRKAS